MSSVAARLPSAPGAKATGMARLAPGARVAGRVGAGERAKSAASVPPKVSADTVRESVAEVLLTVTVSGAAVSPTVTGPKARGAGVTDSQVPVPVRAMAWLPLTASLLVTVRLAVR